MPKQNDDSTFIFFPSQIDVVNKRLFSPLSWNKPLSKTALGESYIMMIDRYLVAKNKDSLDVERVYNLSSIL